MQQVLYCAVHAAKMIKKYLALFTYIIIKISNSEEIGYFISKVKGKYRFSAKSRKNCVF